MSKKLLSILVLVLGLMVIGCSGGGDDSNNVPSDPSVSGAGTPVAPANAGAGTEASSAAIPQKPPVGPDGGPP